MVEIDVTEVDPECRERATAELEQMFRDSEDLKIIVTKDFDVKVTEYLRTVGVFEPYESKRYGGEVVACKTMNYPLEGRLGTCLVANANAPMFSNWEDRYAKMERAFHLAHEKKHISLNTTRYLSVGHDGFYSHAKTATECMQVLADDIASEYLAERSAIALLQDMTEKDLGLQDGAIVSYLFDLYDGLIDILNRHFGALQTFLQESVEEYRSRKITIEVFWPKIYLRTRDAFNALALVTAFEDTKPSISGVKSASNNSTVTGCFKDIWDRVTTCLWLLWDNEAGYNDGLVDIASAFQDLFLWFGVKLSDGPQGMRLDLN